MAGRALFGFEERAVMCGEALRDLQHEIPESLRDLTSFDMCHT